MGSDTRSPPPQATYHRVREAQRATPGRPRWHPPVGALWCSRRCGGRSDRV